MLIYSGRRTAKQWIKEGKYAVKWTRLSCRTFRDNQARLQLFALAYNLGNFLRRLALPRPVKHWSLTTLREKLIKIGAKVVRHAKYVTFQMAEVAVPHELFAAILDRIQRFGVPPPRLKGVERSPCRPRLDSGRKSGDGAPQTAQRRLQAKCRLTAPLETATNGRENRRETTANA